MRNVSIGVSLQEDLTQKAPRIGDALRGLAEQAEALRSSLDFEEINDQFEEFSDRQKKIYDDTQARKPSSDRGVGGATGDAREDAKERDQKSKIIPFSGAGGYMGPARGVQTAGRILNNLGRSGDAGQATGDVLNTVPGMAAKLGPAGAVAAGAFALTAGTVLAGNELSKQYEAVMQESMDLAASLGRLGGSVEENSVIIREAMQEASQAASEFGYTLQEGNAVLKTLATQGVSGTGGVLGYARQFGVDPMSLAYGQARGMRFGAGNLLGYTSGGLEQSGMEPGQFTEYMSSMLGIMEDGLSKGIVRGFSDISGMMNFLSGAGVQYQGQGGARVMSAMNQAMSNATGMSRESDIFLYRAAREGMGGEGGLVDVMRAMEDGMNSQELKSLFSQLEGMQGEGNRSGIVPMLKEALGVSWTDADNLFALMSGGNWEAATAIAKDPQKFDSYEQQLLRAQEEIKEEVREVGSAVTSAKVAVVQSLSGLVGTMNNAVGSNVESQRQGVEEDKFFAQNEAAYRSTVDNMTAKLTKMSVGSRNPEVYHGINSLAARLEDAFRSPDTMSAAQDVSSRLSRMGAYEQSEFQANYLNKFMNAGSVSDMQSVLDAFSKSLENPTLLSQLTMGRRVQSGQFDHIAKDVGASDDESNAFTKIMQTMYNKKGYSTLTGINEEELYELFASGSFQRAFSQSDMDNNGRLRGDEELARLLQNIESVLAEIRDQNLTIDASSSYGMEGSMLQ